MQDTGNARNALYESPIGTTLYRSDAFNDDGRVAAVTLQLGPITDRPDAELAPIKSIDHDPLGRTPDRIGVNTSAGVIPIELIFFTEDDAVAHALHLAQVAYATAKAAADRALEDLTRAQGASDASRRAKRSAVRLARRRSMGEASPT